MRLGSASGVHKLACRIAALLLLVSISSFAGGGQESAVTPAATTEKAMISIMHSGRPDTSLAWLEPFIAEYHGGHPNTQIQIIKGDWQSFHDRISLWITAKKEPDIYLCSIMEYASFSRGNVFLPLNDVLDQSLRDAIGDSLLSAFQSDGRQLGIPAQAGCFFFWYNKEVFAAVGLNPNQPPEDWEELRSNAERIVNAKRAHGIGLNLGRPADVTHLLVGSTYYSATNRPFVDERGKAQFNSPEGVGAVEFIIDLAHRGLTQPSPEQTAKGDLRLLLRDGKVAMNYDSTSMIEYLKEVTDLSSAESSKFGVAPPIASPFSGKAPMVANSIDPWVISSNTRYPQAAKDVMRSLLQTKWAHAKNLAIGDAPFRSDVLKQYRYEPAWIFSRSLEDLKHSIPQTIQVPAGLDDLKAKEILVKYMQRALFKQMDVKQALDLAAKEIEDLIVQAEGRLK